MGFGVSQILPVLTSCYDLPEGSILILEQPDATLHPKVQSELADVLIDVVKNRKVQIILESHSEHLLLRLMRRIAEYEVCDEGISADQTAFYFGEINDGNSKAEQLKVDEYGNISIGLGISLAMRWATWQQRQEPKCSGGKRRNYDGNCRYECPASSQPFFPRI